MLSLSYRSTRDLFVLGSSTSTIVLLRLNAIAAPPPSLLYVQLDVFAVTVAFE
jgi:hypothetical protein